VASRGAKQKRLFGNVVFTRLGKAKHRPFLPLIDHSVNIRSLASVDLNPSGAAEATPSDCDIAGSAVALNLHCRASSY
jgi:hypothetical protein